MDMYITASSATDIYYLIRKHLHGAGAAKLIMGKLYSLVGILEVTEADCIEALVSPVMDYEDAVLEQVARRSKMDYIGTRNQKDYKSGITKVFSPKEFVKYMEQTE